MVTALYGGKNYPDWNYFLTAKVKDLCQKLQSGCTAVACGSAGKALASHHI